MAMEVVAPQRGEIWDVNLDPTIGSEIRKTRPCVIVSPDVLNEHWRTVIVAPLASGAKRFSFRIPSAFEGKPGLIVLDQLKTVDKQRCLRWRGVLDEATLSSVLTGLKAMFVP